MSKKRLIIVNIVGIVIGLAILAGGAYFYYDSISYVKTDEAHVSGEMANITAPVSGKLTNWTMKEGTKISKDEKTGEIKGENSLDVKSIMAGTIVKNEAREGQTVQAGQTLAQTIDMDHLYITANIQETDLKSIEKGDKVEIVIDGDPGTTFEGNVEEIGYATNSTFNLFSQQNSSGNYTKVTQKVPVKISIKNPSSQVLPGMNASVKISK
ncbi:HlyD family efflux transporter periplasmic adaptor subunit [Bacillus changyiensis]|uniref:HlyD family efflux transporter periplasmic adaptor subunit n=1 Tax=Bacillus changyiensis TaxID=3004103 RepID=UPI0022E07E09|nr:HlyD family efflux transporter periplasmic adaptor subunit [Bacillus changyiensis]MDA1476116.1 HlyD family efflux transporter periplasmic adaptor subunit [Bacillus changyiensis]